ncbi:uncharacterized protein LOC106470649 isoform X2 [Limulus polyphemus]|uniref:Uncharacterized protein LOC106470649 isoform X2 n=1 Tax=Limulus polyphemus TaxID=6850 RepID=A0ABM1TIM9_LIMPO|nr:uncharacterized protein LOC106470649 isoform X2 [Limulus polyphemus]
MDDSTVADTNIDEGSIIIYLGVFGVILLLLCLICYCCQKKLQDDGDLQTLNGDTPYITNEGGNNHFVTIDREVNETTTPSPPPTYDAVIEKEIPFRFGNQSPPSYDVALSHQNRLDDSLGLEDSSVSIHFLQS